jgi:hypothetical protein
LLDAYAAHPAHLSYPVSPDQARQIFGTVLMDPQNIVYEVWKDEQSVGVILLTRVVPRVDALLYWVFTDRDLVGKRKLLRNFISFCFGDLGFHRLSMELPEGSRSERFSRRVLSFLLEGESRPRNPEVPKCLTDDWVARQGSRRQDAAWDGERWVDIVLLRLLASEWTEAE